jgi:hypothetical protein
MVSKDRGFIWIGGIVEKGKRICGTAYRGFHLHLSIAFHQINLFVSSVGNKLVTMPQAFAWPGNICEKSIGMSSLTRSAPEKIVASRLEAVSLARLRLSKTRTIQRFDR